MKHSTPKLSVREMLTAGILPNTSHVRRAAEAERTQDLLDAGHGERLENTAADHEAAVKAGDTAKAALIRRRIRNLERRAKRTQGLAYSRCVLRNVITGNPVTGRTGAFVGERPTRGGQRVIPATEATMKVFMPSAPANIRKAMIGEAA